MLTPYAGDGIGLKRMQFIDRLSLKEAFAEKVGCQYDGGSERVTVDPNNTGQLSDWAWVVEGRRGFGKSAFAAWCRGIQEQLDQTGTFIVTYASPDLCANAGVGPLEAALHRLRGQVLRQLGRAHDGRDFGWYSAGEVLRVIAEEAYQKAPRPDRLRCIVFILDNVSILPAVPDEIHWFQRNGLSEVERQVASLIAELSRLDAEGSCRTPRPAVGLLALAYPGFYGRVGQALRSRFVSYQKLEPFLWNDIDIFANRYLGKREKQLVNVLFRLTAGIPDLLQAVTNQVRPPDSIHIDASQSANQISAKTVFSVAKDPDDQLKLHLIEHFRDRGFPNQHINKNNLDILGCLSDRLGSADSKYLNETEDKPDTVGHDASVLTAKEFLAGKFIALSQVGDLAKGKSLDDTKVIEVLEALSEAGVLLRSAGGNHKEGSTKEKGTVYEIGIGALLMNLRTCLGEL